MTEIGPIKQWGGQPRKVYYRPDGQVVKSIPAYREWSKKEDGEILTGTRDANYDRGWLDAPPKEPKLTCPHCRKWHDTDEEIAACKVKQQRLIDWGLKYAKQHHPEAFEKTDVADLRAQIERLTKLVEANNAGK